MKKAQLSIYLAPEPVSANLARVGGAELIDILDRVLGPLVNALRIPAQCGAIGHMPRDAAIGHHARDRAHRISAAAETDQEDAITFPGGVIAYRATLPIKAIAAEVRRRGIPVKISNTASTYACNQIMYTALHLIDQKRLAARGGFIHVPCTPAYVAKQSYPYHEYPSMHLDLYNAVTQE